MLETYINDLKANKNKILDFDEGLFYALVDKAKVNKNKIIVNWKDWQYNSKLQEKTN